MEHLIFSLGLVSFAIIAVIIAIYTKDIKPHNDENDLNDEMAKYIAIDTVNTKMSDYAKHFAKDEKYVSSYKGWKETNCQS